ncbi:MAG TPA: endonuclease MutS2 [Nitrospiraceae bacterium]|nr:endonuclease MutS2 [Nitrospiraceae bacterium]
MFRTSLQVEAADVLDWPKLLEALAAHAHSAQGKQRCLTLRLETDLDAAGTRQEETTEMVALRDQVDSFPSVGFPDISEILARVEKGGWLEAPELRDCSLVLGTIENVSGYMARHPEAARIQSLAKPLADQSHIHRLKRSLDEAILPDGSIAESATPELRRLTHHAQELKQRIRHQLEQILHSKRYAEVLQETYFAQRQGRYVVPVKVEMQGRIPGILHDVSASGATVFLEPRELVDLNNAIKVADLEIDREVRRILRELSGLVAERADDLRNMIEVITELDVITAKAALSRQLRAAPVSLNARGRIVLRRARHPLLLLTKDHVVANDILFDEAVAVLVITGPNTGGKTVTLKILGLFALMVRSGLHLPCDPGSDMGLFPSVYADIGDAQDLTKDLSSFSAHITKMVQLLSEVVDQGIPSNQEAPWRQVLVLLDEPVTSTDPTEGAALASALLTQLAQRGLKVIVTTHYNELKALAQSTPGFANASVQFDLHTLSPTYRLVMGLPGGSAALDIAGRLGMDASILDDARNRLQRNDRLLERLLSDVQERQRELTAELDRARQARLDAEEAAEAANRLLTDLRQSEREERKGLRRRLTQEFQRARAQVQATIDELKRDQKLERAKEVKQRLAHIELESRRETSPDATTADPSRLDVGSRVELRGLGLTGTLLESPQGKKRVRVKVGEGAVLATVSDLVGIGESASAGPSGERRRTAAVGAERDLAGGDAATVIDVRGQAGDEALESVVAALDRATLAGTPLLRIIHGYGTGRLKAVLREYLAGSPYVARSRAGERAEGGDGVTIVELK